MLKTNTSKNTGINSIVMYGVSVLSDLLASNSALLNVSVSLLGTLATTFFAPLVDAGAPGLHLYTLNSAAVAKEIAVNVDQATV